jgi:hypothetical protein
LFTENIYLATAGAKQGWFFIEQAGFSFTIEILNFDWR